MVPTYEWWKTRRAPNRWLSFVVVLALAGCSDGAPLPEPVVEPAPSTLVASEPVTGSPAQTDAAAIQAAVVAGEEGTVYVSAQPGTFPDGESATITNLTTDQAAAVEITDGGFDPIGLTGAAGDELEVRVRYADGSVISYRLVVPAEKPPRVVRTRPPKDAVDVPLNATVVVVFSEPVDERTITPGNVKLEWDGVPIPATLALDESGLTAELTPDHPLGPSTTYTLQVATGVADLTGDALQEAVTVRFQTVPVLSGQIVFTSYSDDDWASGIYDNEIYVMNADGSGIVNLTNNRAYDAAPAVSPDGTRILFSSDRGGDDEIYVMNVDGSGVVNLTNHMARDVGPVWSPDGQRFLFSSDRDGNQEIYAMNADGSGLVRLTDHPADDVAPAWSRDGAKIAYHSDRGEVACQGYGFQYACSDIVVINADGSNPVNLTNTATVSEQRPAWSPDGTKIAFDSDRDAPTGYDYSDVFVMNADGSNMLKVSDSQAGGYWPRWSPDGTRITFTASRGGAAVWVVDADGSNPINLTADALIPAHGPIWSPDGARIAFTMVGPISEFEAANNLEVFVINADGSALVNLTNRRGFEDHAVSWTPQR